MSAEKERAARAATRNGSGYPSNNNADNSGSEVKGKAPFRRSGAGGGALSPVEIAKDYIRRGWSPVPVPFRAKFPPITGWQNLRVTDNNVDDHFDDHPSNIGVILGPASNGLTDIDLDSPEALAVAPYFLPNTAAIFGRASTRSSHWLYKTALAEGDGEAVLSFKDPTPAKADTTSKATLVELRIGGGGKGAQTIFPGSTHKDTGELIEWEPGCDGEPAAVDGPDLVTCVKKVAAAALLARHWPPHGARHDARLALTGFLVRAGLSESDAKLFIEATASAVGDDDIEDLRGALNGAFEAYWGERNVAGLPKLAEIFGEKVAAKVALWLNYTEADSHGDGTAAAAASDAGPPPADLDAAIEEINAKHAFVLEAGKATVLREGKDQIHGRKNYVRISPADFEKAYANREFFIGNHKASLGGIWLKSPRRKQYLGGVVFDPAGRHSDDCKNLWEGFAIKPAKGSWRQLQRHIWAVICKRDQVAFKYLIRWMARAVQRPAEQGDVAVVMRGEEGCGKGIVARALLHLFGQHGLHITNAAHLVGHFNEHLQCCVMLFADEAFFAGDKQHVGVLKAIITEPTIAIEAKYRAVIEARNFLHVIMASNEEWVVPASLEARRFFVLDVSNEKVGHYDYFKAIQDELDAGGYGAMLHDLLKVGLANFKVAAVPQTEGLATQKKLSLKTHEQWWLDVLQRGYVWKSKFGLEEDFHVWHEDTATDLLYTAYLEYARSAGDRYPLSRERFGRFVVQIGKKRQFTAKGSVLIGEHITGGVACASRNFKPVYGYFLGSLHDARKAFTDATKLPITWEDDGGEEDDATSASTKSEGDVEWEDERELENEKAYSLAFSDEDERELENEKDQKAYLFAFPDEDDRELENQKDQKAYLFAFPDEDGSTSGPMKSEDERRGDDPISANESEEKPNFSIFDEDPPFSM